MKINPYFSENHGEYLFPEISKRVAKFKTENPNKPLYRLGIGDATLPLTKSVITAMQKAVIEQSDVKTFHGYGDELGYEFLREKIKRRYRDLGVTFTVDEIIVSDGIASDVGYVTDVFDSGSTAVIVNPTYPEYYDVCTMHGIKTEYVYAKKEDGFLPYPDEKIKPDLIYLCSPNNPTGVEYGKELLKVWIDYALSNGAVIIYDSAYAVFSSASERQTPYTVDGAKNCVIELCSFSKWAGFTGVRCGYTVIPKELDGIRKAFIKIKQVKTNGVSYVTERGAEAVLDNPAETQVNIDYYKENSRIIKCGLENSGIPFVGNSPYVFMKTPDGYTSWQYFERLLTYGVVTTSGSGFGDGGEGFVRLSAFAPREEIEQGIKIITQTY